LNQQQSRVCIMVAKDPLAIRRAQPKIRTSDDTIDLITRLATHHPDAVIAGILNRQGKRTARGLSYTASRVQSLRHHRDIPAYQPTPGTVEGELLTVADAAKTLGTAPSTLHRWINDGFIPAEHDTPGAPGGSASPPTYATCSSTQPPTAGSSCKTPPKPSASPARPSCNVSSEANFKPSTSATDAGKAYASTYPRP
jgi:hypothetical protein